MRLPAEDRPLCDLLAVLADEGYRFVTPTPETHRRVVARRTTARDLRDIFGWSLPFAPEVAGPRLLALLEAASLVRNDGGLLRSLVRVASLDDSLFLHSGYPTNDADSVFFGPDSYRFVDFIKSELAGTPGPQHLVDIGAGSGVGGIIASLMVQPGRLTLTDTNSKALRFARVNAVHNGVDVQVVQGSGTDPIREEIDLVISNPPYMMDEAGRTYRDGGGMHGAALSLEWALNAAPKLAPGGRMLLYSASAIIGGEDRLKERLLNGLESADFHVRYREIDPDVFGEQLAEPGYGDVERIAAVGAVIERLR